LAEEIAHVLRVGKSAHPTNEDRDTIRQQFAPVTIARQYLELLLDES
jgi:hypothetical protein